MHRGTAQVFVARKEKEMNLISQAAEQAIRAGMPTDAAMLSRRMHRYHLALQPPVSQDSHLPECSCCFGKLILENNMAARVGC